MFPDPRYKARGTIRSEHPMGGSSSAVDHASQREDLWGDVREKMGLDTVEADGREEKNRKIARLKTEYAPDQIRKAYRLAHADNGMSQREVGWECDGMSQSQVGKIKREEAHAWLTEDIEV